jgi:hypothetical protein
MKSSHKMAEELYKNAQTAGAAGGQAGPGAAGQQQPGGEQQSGPQGAQSDKNDGKKDGPIDADFEVVDDK